MGDCACWRVVVTDGIVLCRQAGRISAAAMEAVIRRVAPLVSESWFISFIRPDGYVTSVPEGFPDFPFTIIGVTAFSETEAVYHDRVRPLESYTSAYGLLPVPEAADCDGAPAMVKGDIDGQQRVVQATFLRRSKFFFRCGGPTAAALF